MKNTLHIHCVHQYGTFTTPIRNLTTTADGSVLAVAQEQGDLELWDVSTGDCISHIPVPVSIKRKTGSRREERDEVYSLALSDDGLFLAASLRETGDIYLWTFEGHLLCQIKGDSSQFESCEVAHPSYLYYTASVQQMIWLPQSNLLATAGLKKNDGSGVNTIKLWQLSC